MGLRSAIYKKPDICIVKEKREESRRLRFEGFIKDNVFTGKCIRDTAGGDDEFFGIFRLVKLDWKDKFDETNNADSDDSDFSDYPDAEVKEHYERLKNKALAAEAKYNLAVKRNKLDYFKNKLDEQIAEKAKEVDFEHDNYRIAGLNKLKSER